ncbi:MAG: hypothetical protein ACQESR_08610 [Planctomycetota bacterium]
MASQFFATLGYTLPMAARIIPGNPKVKDQVDRIAIERGPVVYCVEQADNPELDLDRIYSPDPKPVNESFEPELLGEGASLRIDAKQLDPEGEDKRVQVKLIPYCAWANRKPGRMRVWLPTKPSQLPQLSIRTNPTA